MTPEEFEALPKGTIVCTEPGHPDHRPELFALRRSTLKTVPGRDREAHALTGPLRGGVHFFGPRNADRLCVWSPRRLLHVNLMREAVSPKKHNAPLLSEFARGAVEAALVGVDLPCAWLAAKEADEMGLTLAPEDAPSVDEAPAERLATEAPATNAPVATPSSKYPEGTLLVVTGDSKDPCLVVTGDSKDPCLVRVTCYHPSDADLYTLELTGPGAGDMRIFGSKPRRTALAPLDLSEGQHRILANEAILRHVDKDAEHDILVMMSAAGTPWTALPAWPAPWSAGTLLVWTSSSGTQHLCTVWDLQPSEAHMYMLVLHGEFQGQLVRHTIGSPVDHVVAWGYRDQGHVKLARDTLAGPILGSARYRRALRDALDRNGFGEARAAVAAVADWDIPTVVQALQDAESERASAEDQMHGALQARARSLLADLQALQPHYPRPITVTVTARDFTISFGKDE